MARIGQRAETIVIGFLLLGSSAAGAQNASAASRIDTYLTRLEGYGFSGVVLVAKGADVIVHNAYGLADQRRRIPMRTDHLFDMGSVTKQFTAAAIIALEDDGRLRVTDSIGKYFADVPADKRGITIHQLLTHTSGLPMGFGGDYERVTREEIVRRALGAELLSVPGERHAYSNAGYSVLAAIVELVSAQPIDVFMRERLFRRAGMTSSSYFPRDTQRVVRAYRDGADLGLVERTAAAGGEMWNLIGNGGMHSTLADMHRWMLALAQARLFSRAARDRLLRPYALHSANYRGTGALHYAYGWYVSTLTDGRTIIWHLGGNGTLNTAVRWHVDDSTLVLYASNTSEFHDPAYPVPVIERILAGGEVVLPPAVMPMVPASLARYAGRYRAGADVIAVEPADGFLRLRGEGQAAFWFATRGDWTRNPELDAWNARTLRAVDQARTRRWEQLKTSYGPEVTIRAIADFETSFWARRQAAHGDYVRTRVIGTEPGGSRYAGRSIIAIDFARGMVVREYFWTKEGVIEDLGPLDDTPVSRQYFPISPGCFAAVAPHTGATSRICFEGTDATISSLGGAESVRLRREPSA